MGQFRVVPAVQTGRTYAEAQVPYGRPPLGLVAAKPLLAVARLGRPLTETVTARAVVSLPVHAGEVLGRVEIRLAWYAGRTLHHLAHLL